MENDGRKHESAIKVMRPGFASYAVPLFLEEADILAALEELLDMCEIVKAASFEEAKSYLDSSILNIGDNGTYLVKYKNHKGHIHIATQTLPGSKSMPQRSCWF